MLLFPLVFPSLLCCLCSPVREVRRAALGALRSLAAASSSPFQPITEKLLRTSEEIIADPAYLSQASRRYIPRIGTFSGTAAVGSPDTGDTVESLQALGALHDSCLAAEKKSQQEAVLAALQQLLRSLQDPCCPSYSVAVLLEALSQVNGEVSPQSAICEWSHGRAAPTNFRPAVFTGTPVLLKPNSSINNQYINLIN